MLQKSVIFKNKRLHRLMQPFGFGFDVWDHFQKLGSKWQIAVIKYPVF
jgi:hypothetical protein